VKTWNALTDGKLGDDLRKIEGPWNMFLPGTDWLNKRKVGEVFRLIDPDKMCRDMGEHQVVALFGGTLSEMLEKHASRHHTMLDGSGWYTNEFGKFNSFRESLSEVLGKDATTDSSIFTVVYLQRAA
jgi:hypothetical protein